MIMELIDKDKIKAEVEKKIHGEQGYSSGDAECGYHDCARDILSFLDTLEVKDVDLDKEFDRYCENLYVIDIQEAPFTEMYDCAKHFYELGLNSK